MIVDKIPVCIISFNRPDYLKQCLQALSKQQNAGKIEIHLFQDNAVNEISKKRYTEDGKILACKKLFKTYFPKGEIHLSDSNIGVALNHFNALTYVFDIRKFKYGIFIEDDIVANDNYVEINRIFFSQYGNNPHIGAFTAKGRNPTTPLRMQCKYVEKLKPFFTATATAMTRDAWLDIYDFVKSYIDIIRKYDYKQRPKSEIVEFYKLNGVDIEKNYVSSQDRVREVAFLKNNRIFLSTETNNAKYIGIYGVHGTEAVFKKAGYDKQIIFGGNIEKFENLDDEEIIKMIEKYKEKLYVS